MSDINHGTGGSAGDGGPPPPNQHEDPPSQSSPPSHSDNPGVEEEKSFDPDDRASTAPSTGNRDNDPLASTVARLELVVNRALDRLAAGEIDELSPQVMTFMNQLFSHGQASRRKGKQPARRTNGGQRPTPRDSGGKQTNHRSSEGGSSSDPARGASRTQSRPRCTYDRCKKPLGHTYDKCFQRQRDEKEREEGRRPRSDDIIIVKKRRSRSPPSDDEEEA